VTRQDLGFNEFAPVLVPGIIILQAGSFI